MFVAAARRKRVVAGERLSAPHEQVDVEASAPTRAPDEARGPTRRLADDRHGAAVADGREGEIDGDGALEQARRGREQGASSAS